MNPIISRKKRHIFFFCLLGALAMLSFTACSKKTSFLNSSVVPAARGTVKVTRDKNDNYVIKLDIQNLAEPERLDPPRKIYVVWIVTDEQVTRNIGKIDSSSGMFSNKLKADFETSSAFKPVRIFITAEDDANVQYANSTVVMTTSNF